MKILAWFFIIWLVLGVATMENIVGALFVWLLLCLICGLLCKTFIGYARNALEGWEQEGEHDEKEITRQWSCLKKAKTFYILVTVILLAIWFVEDIFLVYII